MTHPFAGNLVIRRRGIQQHDDEIILLPVAGHPDHGFAGGFVGAAVRFLHPAPLFVKRHAALHVLNLKRDMRDPCCGIKFIFHQSVTNFSLCCFSGKSGIAFFFQFKCEIRAAGFDDPAAGQHVDDIGFDVIQQALVVGNHQKAAFG